MNLEIVGRKNPGQGFSYEGSDQLDLLDGSAWENSSKLKLSGAAAAERRLGPWWNCDDRLPGGQMARQSESMGAPVRGADCLR